MFVALHGVLYLRPLSRYSEFAEFGGHGFAMRRRAHVLVDVKNCPVGTDVESPARCERLIHIHHAIGLGNLLRGITQERVIQAERLREGLIGFGSIDANRKVGDIERSDLIATLTE
jgi:hypothetical protein